LRQIFKDHFNISVITKMEFLGFERHTEESFEKAIKFIEYADIIDLDEEIVNTVISMRRHKNIKLPDAIIASTAKTNKWTLVTRNERDFRNIDVEVFNPFQC
jgi:predicted nucleic acid-binding protein